MDADTSAAAASGSPLMTIAVEPDVHKALRRLIEAFQRHHGVRIQDFTATWIDTGLLDGEGRDYHELSQISVRSIAEGR